MTPRTKELITLTDIDVRSNRPEIAITMSGGLHALKGITVHQNIWETIGFLACELTTAPPVIRDISFKGPADLRKFFRFDIDSDLALKMAAQYHELGDCDLTRMNEDIINGFDEVNGNNTVSQSVGCSNLAVGISTGKIDLTDKEPEMDWADKLANIIFAGDAYDPEQQGVNFVHEDLDDNKEVDLNVVQAVGNVFVTGVIGDVNIRIYKSHVVQVLIGTDKGFGEYPTQIFSIDNKKSFITSVQRLISKQLS